jgi:hypothetical protein
MTPAELMKLSKQHAAILANTRIELALNYCVPSRDIIAAACAEMGISEKTWRALESFRIERGLPEFQPGYSITAR